MKDYIVERAIRSGNHIIKTNATIRDTAKVFKISKSTVHKDVTVRLKKIDSSLAQQVRKVLDQNYEEKHLRGGLVTQMLYKQSI